MRKFLEVIRMAVTDALIYRADVLIFVLSGTVRPFIFLFIWLATLSSGAKVPLTRQEFVSYYLLVAIVTVWAGAWSAPFVAARIRSGRISPHLLRPLDYIFFDLGNNIGEKVLKFMYLIPVGMFLGWYFHLHLPDISFFTWILFVISLIIAFLITYLIEICVGLSAFWMDDSSSLGDLSDLLIFVFSGILFPLVTLPLMVQKLAVFLPYRYMISFPIEIYLQHLSSWDFALGMGLEFFWLAVVFLVYRSIWHIGIKKYSSVGA